MQRAKSVEHYIESHPEWDAALVKLRKAILDCGLEETIKWGTPCYTAGGKNVVGIGAFKGYVGLWFHQGALLKDPDGVLINAQEGKTKALRQWRFQAAREIKVGRVKAYVREALANQEAGKAVRPSAGPMPAMPPELEAVLDRRHQKAFAALTPGRQREYCEYVASAKRESTRVSRAEKVLPMIAEGVGLNDRYRC